MKKFSVVQSFVIGWWKLDCVMTELKQLIMEELF